MQHEIKIMHIANGHAGTRETLRVMHSLVLEGVHSPAFQGIAQRIWNQSEGMDLEQVVSSVDTLIRRYYEYVDDEYNGVPVEKVKAPIVMWDELQQNGFFTGDCDDVSVMLATILTAMHFKVRFMAIIADSSMEFTHVFVEVKLPGFWKRLDPTVALGVHHIDYGQMIEEI